MKKTTLPKIKLLGVLIIMLFVANSGYAAGVWTNPATAPGTNLEIPVHTGGAQVKAIGTGPGFSGGLSVGTFLVNSSSIFNQDVFFKGAIIGSTLRNPADGTAVALGGAPTDNIALMVKGAAKALLALESDKVASGSADVLAPLCADASGKVVLCNPPAIEPPPDYCSNFESVQSDIPQGARVSNSNGQYICTYGSVSASLRMDSACDANVGDWGTNWAFTGGSEDNNRPTAGSFTMSLVLPRAPNYTQTLYIRIRSAHPDYHYVFMGVRTQNDQWKSYEGAAHAAEVSTKDEDHTSVYANRVEEKDKPNIFPFKYANTYPGAALLVEDPPNPDNHNIHWGYQLKNTDGNPPVTIPSPMVVTIPAGQAVVSLNKDETRFLCTALGHQGKHKESYVDQIEYKFVKSVPDSQDYTYTIGNAPAPTFKRNNNDLNS